MSDLAIRVENLGKRYRIGGRQVRYKRFTETVMDTFSAPIRRLKNLGKPTPPEETIWALKDVCFEVERGEVLGIIGRNGAGKTTLLKILSRITEPTEGRAEIHGRVGSLLEVGTGFHPELTGRENVYLNGAILGMRRAEIERKFDEIVEFSGVERFLDTPVKRYSSGMYVRLAFAVAAHLEPEILLVDEVLAVGDAAFQKKCLGKMGEVAGEGRTVLFVSHSMGSIRRLCNTCLLLHEGGVKARGDTAAVVAEYESAAGSDLASCWTNQDSIDRQQPCHIESISVLDDSLIPRNRFLNTQQVLLRFVVQIADENPNYKIGFDLLKDDGIVCRSENVDTNQNEPLPTGTHELWCKIPARLLNAGDYQVRPLISIHCVQGLTRMQTPVIAFRVDLDTRVSEFHSVLTDYNHPGAVFPLLEWKLAGQ